MQMYNDATLFALSPENSLSDLPMYDYTEKSQRTLSDIENDIWSVLQKETQIYFELGKYLDESKSFLPHGRYLPWAMEKFDLSADSVRNYVRLYEGYQKTDMYRNLKYSAALKLLDIADEDERIKFCDCKYEVDGKTMTVFEMKVRQLVDVIDGYVREKRAVAKNNIINATDIDAQADKGVAVEVITDKIIDQPTETDASDRLLSARTSAFQNSVDSTSYSKFHSKYTEMDRLFQDIFNLFKDMATNERSECVVMLCNFLELTHERMEKEQLLKEDLPLGFDEMDSMAGGKSE